MFCVFVSWDAEDVWRFGTASRLVVHRLEELYISC